MAGKLIHIRNELGLGLFGGNTTDATPESDDLASDFTLKGAEDELIGFRGVKDIEAGPVHRIGGCGKSMQTVPEKGCRVCKIAGEISMSIESCRWHDEWVNTKSSLISPKHTIAYKKHDHLNTQFRWSSNSARACSNTWA